MSHGGNEAIDSQHGTVLVRTKPCWICGQYSSVAMSTAAYDDWAVRDVHIEAAWPEGTAEDKQLLRTGIHTKCWDQEFPTNQPEETK